MNVSGKVAVVTGASRGIGRAIALTLAEAGADVAVNYCHDEAAADAVAADVRQMGRRAITVRADVRDLEQIRSMAARVHEELGTADIVVNNAGILRDNLLTFMKDSEWNDVLDTNLRGAFYVIKVFGREMGRRRSGTIVNISSDAGLLGDHMRANYASSKAGLLGLTKTAARELAASGIRVNAVAPGVIATDMITAMPDSRRERMLSSVPQGRFGKPEEVARVVLFLASDAAAYITGQVVSVDGGLRM